jgi:hypothetical protein
MEAKKILETITLNTWNGFIKFYIKDVLGFTDETSHFGGYDLIGEIEIQSDNYNVKGGLNYSTVDIYDFYIQLNQIFNSLTGVAKFYSYEDQLSFFVSVDKKGHISIEGEYREDLVKTTKLIFELECDQSYLKDYLAELKIIVDKYGDNESIKM